MQKKDEIYNFLSSNGLELVEQETSESFGDYYDIFATDDFQLRFSSTKAIEYVDICSREDGEEWFDLALVKALLQHPIIQAELTTIEAYISFLMQEFEYIRVLFNQENYPSTKRKLQKLANERAKRLFPDMSM